ncbi:hypothetical protein ZIOFF_063484 [Zingiber officinale]|uniref:AB hydrolase-1 domain-containing protein n=1 Tax=Zingiber officinale TaxID=94328 RepID=A0A8J5F1N8_ZINOF|nr:hypothetical protein ZIOFF_063484 [Zingiber officinale]
MVLVDIRNHGRSAGLKELDLPHNMFNGAKDLANLVKFHGWAWPDVVLGHSMGGKVALQFAASCAHGDYGESAIMPKQLWVLDSVPGEVNSNETSGEVEKVLQTLEDLPSPLPSRKIKSLVRCLPEGGGRDKVAWLVYVELHDVPEFNNVKAASVLITNLDPPSLLALCFGGGAASKPSRSKGVCLAAAASILWVIDHMLNLGFSKMLSNWIGSNLNNDGEHVEWAFDLQACIDMFNSYREESYWSLLESPPNELEIAIVRAENSDRWPEHVVNRLNHLSQKRRGPKEGKVSFHLLPKSGHWVHVDNPKGLLEIVAPNFYSNA